MLDVVVAGGGYVGLGVAVAIKQAAPHLNVQVIEAAPEEVWKKDMRASAIIAAAARMLDVFGIWQELEPEAQPIRKMIVTDSKTSDPIRPVFLTFDGDVEEGRPFAHMVPNVAMVGALRGVCERIGVTIRHGLSVSGFVADNRVNTVTLSDGSSLETRLLVACDGVRSALRDMAGIKTVRWDYDQSGIVTTVEHDRPHEGCAEEHFLPSGPFAVLPLKGNRSSLVWTERTADADRLGLDIGSLNVLERYQSWRRFDTLRMGVTTDVLNRLFSNDVAPIRFARDFGLGIVDRLPKLKSYFIGQAAGAADKNGPRLLAGETI